MKNEIKKLLQELKKKEITITLAKDMEQGDKIKTGVFAIDYLLSGGVGNKHRLEFWGKESSGKTTFALCCVAKFQSLNKICIYLDAEHSFDKVWAEKLGVDTGNLLIIEPDSLENAGDILYNLVISNEVDLIVIDSIVSLIPKQELERDTDEPTMALAARVNSLLCRKINSALAKSNTAMIFINQLREKIGGWGNPYTTSGGHALLHFYDTRIEFKLGKPIDMGTGQEKERMGYEINLRCNKNKKGVPDRKAVIDFYLNGHLDNNKSLFYAALRFGVITQKGNTYSFNDKKAVGKDAFIQELNDKEWKDLEEKIWETQQKEGKVVVPEHTKED